jgi:ABC-2 type transport system ATP-binding protein
LLEVDNVSKNFRTVEAVKNLSFKIKPGTIFGLLGPNGAGKTTTMRMLMNILKPDEGEIRYNGISRLKIERKLFGYLPEERGLYQPAKVLNLLIYFGMLNRLSRHRAEVEAIRFLDKLGLTPYTKHRINELSKGVQQKIQFIIASLHNPEVLILDEPFVGLDPINQIVLRKIIQKYKADGKVIILSTHQLSEAEKLSDYICLINQGKVILDGSLSDIKKRYREDAFYIESEEDLSFLRDINSIEIIEERNQGYKIAFNKKSSSRQKITQMIFEKADVKKFIQVEPTLHDIFITLIRKSPNKVN